MLTALTAPALPMATDPSSPSMNVSTMAWVTTIGVILALLVLDLATSGRKPHEVTFREASLWSIFYTVVGVAFGIWVWKASGAEFGKEWDRLDAEGRRKLNAALNSGKVRISG